MGTREELLEHLWTEIINSSLRPGVFETIMRSCDRDPDGPFADTGPALKRLLDAGAATDDLQLVLRSAAYEAVFGTLYALDDPGVEGGDVFMLHEELLTADPTGRDGRPGSAAAARMAGGGRSER